jgi:hypothetical protein
MFVELQPENNSPTIVNMSSPQFFMHNRRSLSFVIAVPDVVHD